MEDASVHYSLAETTLVPLVTIEHDLCAACAWSRYGLLSADINDAVILRVLDVRLVTGASLPAMVG